MAIWELQPQNLDHDYWITSRFKERVVVRADDEERARDIATLAFRAATERDISKDVPLSPWDEPDLVPCRQLVEHSYDDSGPDAILDPPEYDHEWRH